MTTGKMEYRAALDRAEVSGLSQCDDAAAMASYCNGPLQIIAGAVSPALVWWGAMRSGLSLVELAQLTPHQIDDLQWV